MTVVAALVHEGKVWMGSDSLYVHSNGTKHFFSKIWLDETSTWVFGIAGSLSYRQAVQYAELPKSPADTEPYEYLVRTWMPALREKLTARKELFDSDWDVRGGGQILLGSQGKLFKVVGFAVVPIEEPFFAIGSGEGAAYGVLHFCHNSKSSIGPKGRLRHAITAAADHYEGVGGSHNVLSV
ncbi:MAG: hypothetical protein WDZ93_03860 [Candidatus Paceibacterota bacterium]